MALHRPPAAQAWRRQSDDKCEINLRYLLTPCGTIREILLQEYDKANTRTVWHRVAHRDTVSFSSVISLNLSATAVSRPAVWLGTSGATRANAFEDGSGRRCLRSSAAVHWFDTGGASVASCTRPRSR